MGGGGSLGVATDIIWDCRSGLSTVRGNRCQTMQLESAKRQSEEALLGEVSGQELESGLG